MLIAVDTNVLLDLAVGTEAIADALLAIRERLPDSRFVVPPTVLHELGLLFKTGEKEAMRKAAYIALSKLREWGIRAVKLGSRRPRHP